LVTGISKLEIWCCRRELVDELVDCICEASIFVALEVGLEIVFGETFVNLEM
jgi:hypothetical protein